MQRVVSVVFRKAGKVYYFDPDGLQLKPGDSVIVKTSRGVEFGEVVAPAQEMPEELIPGQLKKVIRKANEDDLRKVAENRAKEEEALKVCQQKTAKHGLEMKLADVECIFDGSKMLFYFTAEERVDFRDLVRDLASIFKTRIEMRQIGVRDEAKMIGGLGPCGRRLCCTLFPGDFEPVSIRMAKEQNLPLNPMKISGICSRLMCCLKYEYEVYKDFKGRAPRKGTMVTTSLGEGKIVDYNVPRELVTVELEGGLWKQVPLCEVCSGHGGGQTARAKTAEQPEREEATGAPVSEHAGGGTGAQETEARPETKSPRPSRRRGSRSRGRRPESKQPPKQDPKQ